MGTIAETLIQKGEERGMAAGLAEGEVTGKSEGLLLLLESRFGAVPTGIKALIDGADIGQLDEWFRKALKASMLEEVFHKRQ